MSGFSLKGVAVVFFALLIIVIVIGALSTTSSPPPPQKAAPFSFNIIVRSISLLDNDEGHSVRGTVLADVVSSSVNNYSAELIMLPQKPHVGIYTMEGLPLSPSKQAIIASFRKEITSYGIIVNGISLQDALNLKDSVIIIPSEAMPYSLAQDGKLRSLIENNTVIFFGKPLDISADDSGSQVVPQTDVYHLLGVAENGQSKITGQPGGPKVSNVANATILSYNTGWLVLYDNPDDPSVGAEIARLVLTQGWQQDSVLTGLQIPFALTSKASALAFYSEPGTSDYYWLRLIYRAASSNSSVMGIRDLGGISKTNATLSIPSLAGTNKTLSYGFELHEDNNFPVSYDMSLQFTRDGTSLTKVFARSITMKNLSIESGTVKPNISSGNYDVQLVDQYGFVHAEAFTHIPLLEVKLVRIEGTNHIFKLTEDGKPASLVAATLSANGNESFDIRTDQNGEVSVPFMLSSGVHSFTVDLAGEKATTYFRKTDDSQSLLLVAVFLGATLFLGIAFFFSTRKEKKWAIKTHQRAPLHSRTVRIPDKIFMDIFRKTQADRAPGLPLSISDVRMGLRKHASYKGSMLFVTDSNVFGLLEGLSKGGHLMSFDGYYFPSDMADGRAVEYWVMKRMINDHFIENGEELPASEDADFEVGGRLIHLWGQADASKLVQLCRKKRNLLLFPDEQRLSEFRRQACTHDPFWMELCLQMRYGRLECLVIDEFLARRSDGNL